MLSLFGQDKSVVDFRSYTEMEALSSVSSDSHICYSDF